MKKHIQNLHRLCEKMAARYGKDDVLVLELRQEIEVQEAKSSKSSATANLRRDIERGLAAQPIH